MQNMSLYNAFIHWGEMTLWYQDDVVKHNGGYASCEEGYLSCESSSDTSFLYEGCNIELRNIGHDISTDLKEKRSKIGRTLDEWGKHEMSPDEVDDLMVDISYESIRMKKLLEILNRGLVMPWSTYEKGLGYKCCKCSKYYKRAQDLKGHKTRGC